MKGDRLYFTSFVLLYLGTYSVQPMTFLSVYFIYPNNYNEHYILLLFLVFSDVNNIIVKITVTTNIIF